ncbi:hypothetical protein M3Y98_01164300 [Aphelenchoides besseyi]|nr:hypothetical protein M3Y98_01164300 [Aphelenchoides besseyi]
MATSLSNSGKQKNLNSADLSTLISALDVSLRQLIVANYRAPIQPVTPVVAAPVVTRTPTHELGVKVVRFIDDLVKHRHDYFIAFPHSIRFKREEQITTKEMGELYDEKKRFFTFTFRIHLDFYSKDLKNYTFPVEYDDLLKLDRINDKTLRAKPKVWRTLITQPRTIEGIIKQQALIASLHWAQKSIDAKTPIITGVTLVPSTQETYSSERGDGKHVNKLNMTLRIPQGKQPTRVFEKNNMLRLTSEYFDHSNVCVKKVTDNELKLQLVMGRHDAEVFVGHIEAYSPPVTVYESFTEFMPASILRSLDALKSGEMDEFVLPRPDFNQTLLQYHTSKKAIMPYLEVYTELSDLQLEAMFAICTSVHKKAPFILFGPPGTGKTRTISATISCLLEMNPNIRILLCAPSNMAANRLAEKLLEDCPEKEIKRMLRLYSPSYDFSDRNRKLDQISFFDQRFERFKIPRSFLQYRVIISTLACTTHLISDPEVSPGFFTHLIVDEAGQASEMELYIPVGGLCTTETSVVLCGDPKQLASVCPLNLPQWVQKKFVSPLIRYMTLSEYKRDKRLCVQLLECFRCHEAISKIASQLFYDGKLKPNPSPRAALSECGILPKKILFVHVEGEEKRIGSTFRNEVEARAVIAFTEHLLLRPVLQTHNGTTHLKACDLGIISPYKAQTRFITQRLESYENITIESVERFQGSERKAIIMTTVRSGSNGLGFIDCDLRLNTAITRAEHLLVVIGNRKALSTHATWNKFLNYCDVNGSSIVWNGRVQTFP